MAIREYLRVQFGLYITSRILHRIRHSPFLSTAGRNNENWTKTSRDTYYIFITDETSAYDQEVVPPQKQRFHFDRSFILYIYYPPSIIRCIFSP